MKKTFVLLSVLCTLFINASFAQVINGDLNHNDNLDVEDVTLLIDGYLTGEAEVINTTVAPTDPFESANYRVVGRWYKSAEEYITFYEDGTTDYIAGCTYRFLPIQGRIIFFNEDRIPVTSLKVPYLTEDYLAVLPTGSDDFVIYKADIPVTITLSETIDNIAMSFLSYRLAATVLPSDAGPVTWTSSDESIVTVTVSSSSDKICFVKTMGIGTAVVTAEVEGAKASCTMNVYDPNSVLVTDITLSSTTISLEVGQSSGVMTTIAPSNAANKTLKWTSSNPDVATVSSSGNTEGIIKATGFGTATITCAATDGSGVTATCEVTVINTNLVSGITLSDERVELDIKETYTLTPTITPSDAGNKSVNWTSNKPEVATVNSDGEVTAKRPGRAVITCAAADESGVKAYCYVVVSPYITYTVNGIKFKMVYINGGTFKMGAQSENSYFPNYDPEASSDESPVHDVTLNDFCIGETEVTQGLWKAVMGSYPTVFPVDDYPATGINWLMARTFITMLNQLTGEKFRLPTEAEWEFAARGGTKSQGYKYSGSDNVYDVAQCYDSEVFDKVAKLQPNELGLYDMSGNVSEWCQDYYDAYSPLAQDNPKGPESGSRRVHRGGSCGWGDWRVSSRASEEPGNRDYHYMGHGLRLAK